MTKKVEFIFEDESGKELLAFKSKSATKLFNKLKQGTATKLFIQEDGFGKQFVGDYVVKGLDNEPIPPDMNELPVITIETPIQAMINTDVKINPKVSDPDGLVIDTEWKQLTGTPVALTIVEEGEYSATFKATEVGQYSFLFNAFDDRGGKAGREIIVNVLEKEPEPEPTCPTGQHWDAAQGKCVPDVIPEPTGDVLYDSLRDSKLHDGQVRTIKQEGSITPGGLGIECRASGNPRVQVNDDGTYSLICDTGHGRYYLYCKNYNSTMELTAAFWNEAKGQDISKKKRSRHNEGGDCENRPGLYGLAVDRAGWGSKRETCHNIHDQSTSGDLPAKMETKKYNVWRFTVKDENGKVRQIGEMDGVKFMDKFDSSPKPYMLDITKFMEQSYEWVRQNIDSGTGEIRIKQHRVLKA